MGKQGYCIENDLAGQHERNAIPEERENSVIIRLKNENAAKGIALQHERAKVKRLVEAVRKCRGQLAEIIPVATNLADQVKESMNVVMGAAMFGGEVVFTNVKENVKVHMVVSKVEVNTD